MRGWLLLLLLAMPAAAAQQPGHGERVDVTGVEFPAFAVADRPFHINVTVRNREAVQHHVLLFASLYEGSSATPCEGARLSHQVSRFLNSQTLGPMQEVRVEGEREHWAQQVNGSRLPGEGAYEVCVWARMGQCPGELAACFLDYEPTQLAVRLRNGAPQVRAVAEPPSGTTATSFAFRAEGSDPDGDVLRYAWTIAGQEQQGARASHRFATPGTHTVTLNATDGYDFALATVRVNVAAAPAGGGPIPSGGALLALAALTLAAGRALRPR